MCFCGTVSLYVDEINQNVNIEYFMGRLIYEIFFINFTRNILS